MPRRPGAGPFGRRRSIRRNALGQIPALPSPYVCVADRVGAEPPRDLSETGYETRVQIASLICINHIAVPGWAIDEGFLNCGPAGVSRFGARMYARSFKGVVLAVAVSITSVPGALAGGGGHGGGAVFRAAGARGIHGGWGGGMGSVGRRGMPPVSGVIHERSGMRPYFSAYGHTDTAARFGGFALGGVPGYGHTATALPHGGDFRSSGWGHVGTALRYGAGRRFGEGRRTLGRAGLRRRSLWRIRRLRRPRRGHLRRAGPLRRRRRLRRAGGPTASRAPTAGPGATRHRTSTGRVAGRPIAPRRRWRPVSPSRRWGRAPTRPTARTTGTPMRHRKTSGWSPRVVNPYRGARWDCRCGGRGEPVIYRYGIGTAY